MYSEIDVVRKLKTKYMKAQLKCTVVQIGELNDVVVFNSEKGEATIPLPKGEGINFKPGSLYNIEFTETKIVDLPKKKIALA
jgi:hypothetical protein